MTPQEHKARAEEHLDAIADARYGSATDRYHLSAAQVHATLALVPEPQQKETPEAERHWQSAIDMQRQRDDALNLLRDEVKRAQRTRPSSGGTP